MIYFAANFTKFIMKNLILLCCCGSFSVANAQRLVMEQYFPKIHLSIQSMLSISMDTLRVGGVNADGIAEWMDFETRILGYPLYKNPIRIPIKVDFKPTALQFLNRQQLLLAGHRQQDTLFWALYNTDSAKIIRQGMLPDSLRTGQINVVRRLSQGDLLLGGKKQNNLLLIRLDSVGNIKKVLYEKKVLKDEILDIAAQDSGKIMVSGTLEDFLFEQKWMYILMIDSLLNVSKFKIAGTNDSLNTAFSTILSPTQLPIVVGTTQKKGVLMWFDKMQEIQKRLVLPSKIGFKQMLLQPISPTVMVHRNRIWACDMEDKLHIFWVNDQ